MPLPIIWRYLLNRYVKVLTLSTVTFIAILFVSRAKQIAQFAALGTGFKQLAAFALFLIPYVLPLALPISCLIGSILLFQRLSQSGELRALRASGLALRQITAPILIAGAVMALVNFFVASELATHCRMVARQMEGEAGAVNPLHLLQNGQLIGLSRPYVDMETVVVGEEAKNLTFVCPNPASGRLALLSADRALSQEGSLILEGASLVTSLDGSTLVIDSQELATTPLASFASLTRQIGSVFKNSHLKLGLLLAKIGEDPATFSRDMADIFRRLSLGLAALTFTLMGCAFGMEGGRRHARWRTGAVILLTALFIASFSVGMGTSGLPLAATLFLLPHALIVPLSLWALKRTTRGMS
ncbi:MAG: LptF/LptG family permease [Parachlamydiales bacterium]